jgi:hypothetical protein
MSWAPYIYVRLVCEVVRTIPKGVSGLVVSWHAVLVWAVVDVRRKSPDSFFSESQIRSTTIPITCARDIKRESTTLSTIHNQQLTMMPIPEQQSSMEAFARFSAHATEQSSLMMIYPHPRAVLARKLRRVKRKLFLEAVGEVPFSADRSPSPTNADNEDDCSCDSTASQGRVVHYHGRCGKTATIRTQPSDVSDE